MAKEVSPLEAEIAKLAEEVATSVNERFFKEGSRAHKLVSYFDDEIARRYIRAEIRSAVRSLASSIATGQRVRRREEGFRERGA